MNPASWESPRVGPSSLELVRPLRHRVLRAGQPFEASLFAGDELPDSRHLAAWMAGRLIGCCTLIRAEHPGVPQARWQLRGMAVEPEHRSRGVGRALLRWIESDLGRQGELSLWCNARLTARAFYAREGWREVGEVFEAVGLPHIVMARLLGRT
ncbi:MAG: GNAT family N-acetyltransferase [Candidatus Sericytochromatia bacterium]|nr:GNAT family N-acetyltransferase [Candidatus Sericytochromatia bacterium]